MKNKVTELQKIDVKILQKYGKIIEKFQKYTGWAEKIFTLFSKIAAIFAI